MSDPETLQHTANLFARLDLTGRLGDFLRPVFIQWGITGILSIIGLMLVPVHRFGMLGLIFASLAIGALISSLVAADIGRMLELMTPVMVISSAYLFSELWGRSRWLALVLFLLLAARLFWVPTSLTPRDSFLFATAYPRIALFGLQVLTTLIIIVVLRGRLYIGLKTKLEWFKATAGELALLSQICRGRVAQKPGA